MSSDWLARLPSADRLRLLLFDAELRRLPRPFLDALWADVDALEEPRRAESSSSQEMETPGASSRK